MKKAAGCNADLFVFCFLFFLFKKVLTELYGQMRSTIAGVKISKLLFYHHIVKCTCIVHNLVYIHITFRLQSFWKWKFINSRYKFLFRVVWLPSHKKYDITKAVNRFIALYFKTIKLHLRDLELSKSQTNKKKDSL